MEMLARTSLEKTGCIYSPLLLRILSDQEENALRMSKFISLVLKKRDGEILSSLYSKQIDFDGKKNYFEQSLKECIEREIRMLQKIEPQFHGSHVEANLRLVAYRILNSVAGREGNLESVLSENGELLRERDIRLERVNLTKNAKERDELAPFLEKVFRGTFCALILATPWAILREGFRVLPGRTFSQAIPMIRQSIWRAFIGSSLFSSVVLGVDKFTIFKQFQGITEYKSLVLARNVVYFAFFCGVLRFAPFSIFPVIGTTYLCKIGEYARREKKYFNV